MEILNLFQESQYRKDAAHVILEDMKEILNVGFVCEAFPKSIDDNEQLLPISSSNNIEKYYDDALSSLAKYHAATEAYINLNRKQIDELKILHINPFSEKNFSKIKSSIKKYLMDLRDTYPHTFLDNINIQDVEVKIKGISEKLNNFDNWKKLMINGNYCYENLDTNCKMIDFSYAAFHCPLFDVFQFVNSFSIKTKWDFEIEKVKNRYYQLLTYEMKNSNIDITKSFPRGQYEENFTLLKPIMKILFHLKQTSNKTYNELSEILNILNLKPKEANESIISFEDCYSVCSRLKTEKYHLNSFETIPQEGRNGFLGEHHDLTVTIGNHIRKKFFLKGVPHCEALQEFEKTVGSFFKETMFYSRYIPLLKKYGIRSLENIVPECYFANEHKYIVLDNLKTYGFQALSPRQEMNNDIILNVIKILAKFNASCVILEEVISRQIGRPYRLFDEFEKEFKEAFYSMDPVIDSHRNSGTGGMIALTEIIDFDDKTFKFLAEKACRDQVIFAQPSKKWRNTICHADFWTKNFMIKFDENRVKQVMMIDFQTYRYAPPAQDLMTFIYLNTNRDLRIQFMNDWLDCYYKVFEEILQEYSIDICDILPQVDFKESCEYYRQFAITQCITDFQVILVPPNILDPILEDEENARKIFLGSRYDLVAMVWPMDEVYRRRLTESVEELKNCLISKTIAAKKNY